METEGMRELAVYKSEEGPIILWCRHDLPIADRVVTTLVACWTLSGRVNRGMADRRKSCSPFREVVRLKQTWLHDAIKQKLCRADSVRAIADRVGAMMVPWASGCNVANEAIRVGSATEVLQRFAEIQQDLSR